MDKNLKYKLTKESILVGEKTLYRIKALKEFNDVSKGDLGGLIEKESNLSQHGLCWIYDDAKVYDNAQVSGKARVVGNARVYGDAMVFDNAKVFDDSQVYGNAKVYGGAWVYNDAQVYDNAQVYDDAVVCGNAQVFDKPQVYDNAWVYNNAKVYGDAQVFCKARVYGNAEIYGYAQIYGNARISDNAKVYNYAHIFGYSQIYGEAWIYGDSRVYGTSHVYDKTQISRDSWPFSPFFLGFTKHCITTISHTQLKIGCKILSIDEWKQMGKELVRDIRIPDEDIELYIEAIRLAEIHIDFIKKNIKIKEELKRWRAEKGCKYWITHDDFTVWEHTDERCYTDDINYKNINYFRTEEEAKAAAEDMRKVLLRHAGELHDFTWALDKLRQGCKVRRHSWHPERYLHYFPSKTKGITNPYDSHSDICEGFVNGLEYTDWEIYEEE